MTHRVESKNRKIECLTPFLSAVAAAIGLTFVAERVEVGASQPHHSAARIASPEAGRDDPVRSEADVSERARWVGGEPEG